MIDSEPEPDLYFPCLFGNLQEVKKIIKNNKKFWLDWESGLEAACIGGNVNIAKLMISKGASDFDEVLDKIFRISSIHKKINLNIIKLLIKYLKKRDGYKIVGINDISYKMYTLFNTQNYEIISYFLYIGVIKYISFPDKFVRILDNEKRCWFNSCCCDELKYFFEYLLNKIKFANTRRYLIGELNIPKDINKY